jgi:hypothetical protein
MRTIRIYIKRVPKALEMLPNYNNPKTGLHMYISFEEGWERRINKNAR